MRIVDLTTPMDPAYRALVPEEYRSFAGNLAPEIRYLSPAGEGREVMMRLFGCPAAHLPSGEGWASEWLSEMKSHCGTHVDAPSHSGRYVEGRPARTMSDIALDELFRPGLVLDVRPWAKPDAGIGVDALACAIEATGRQVQPGDAVLIRTGQERYTPADPEFFHYPGMSGDGTRFLTALGATCLGTDAFAWDRPFPVMREAYTSTGDRGEIWDGHFAIVDKEAFIIQQLANLGELPLAGFEVGFFPLKLLQTSAAPCRAVAFVQDAAPAPDTL